MNGLVPIFEAMKTGDKYRDYCIDDAIFHLKKASEALQEGLADPCAWYQKSESTAKVLAKSLPFIIALSQTLKSPDESDQKPEEN
jgi:hypothetical protein